MVGFCWTKDGEENWHDKQAMPQAKNHCEQKHLQKKKSFAKRLRPNTVLFC
jgi:hypothetical protein